MTAAGRCRDDVEPDGATVHAQRDVHGRLEPCGSTRAGVGARRGLNAGFLATWPSMPRVEQFTIYKRGSIFNRQVQREARAGKPPSDYYGLLESTLPFRFSRDFREITIPILGLANEGDPFFGSQPEQAYELLDSVPRSRKSLVYLTAQKGASLHDQPVGPERPRLRASSPGTCPDPRPPRIRRSVPVSVSAGPWKPPFVSPLGCHH